MNKQQLKEYLLREESAAFRGWDFSYIADRTQEEDLPWDYREIVGKYLLADMNMLDMGTGGGEFLLSLKHSYNKTSVTEAYPPNIQLCREKLQPLGIKVYAIDDSNDMLSEIPDNTFDIILNRHEAYREEEVYRILKSKGIFITQQVGAYNNKDLATFFDAKHKDRFPENTLEKAEQRLAQNGFEILYGQEDFPKTKFYDLGAVAYFAKIIKWEFNDFSVEKHFDKFLELQTLLESQGYIQSTAHRYIIVSQKQ